MIRVARWETTSETGTAYISAYFEFIPGLVCGGFRIDEKLIVSIMICPFVLFLLTIVVSVLRFIASDYPFDIFKLLLDRITSKVDKKNTMIHSLILVNVLNITVFFL